MRRLLGTALLVLVAAGCQRLDISDYRRPYACVANRDGGLDGGRQCLPGWSCGFDDRCFDRALDGGQRPAEWRCAEDSQCPTAWRCGQAVGEQRFCQQLDAGAPSPCADDEGCQGGWRCGVGERCFDPGDPRDAGERGCASDLQCPDLFRCSQDVPGRPRRCMQRGVGADAPCLADEGCEGGRRCDLFASTCVAVADVVSPGDGAPVGVRLVNPRHLEPAPRLFAMSTPMRVSTAFAGGNATQGGLLMAWALADGGLRVAAQLEHEERVADGGATTYLLFERSYAPRGGPDPVELAVVSDGVALRYADGGAQLLWLASGAWQDLGPTTLLRQRDALLGDRSELIRVSGSRVEYRQATVDFGPFAVHEVFPRSDEQLVVVTSGAVFSWNTRTDAGARLPDDGGLRFPPAPSLGATGQRLVVGGSPDELWFVLDVPLDGGARAALGYGLQDQQQLDRVRSTRLTPACPDGANPAQLASAIVGNGTGLLARCPSLDGGTLAVASNLVTDPFATVRYEPFIESPVPFQWEVVPQRAGALVRAHAASNGRAWRAEPAAVLDAPLAGAPLRPVILDRQPLGFVSYLERGTGNTRLLVHAADRVFGDEPLGGLVARLVPPEGTPLSTVVGASDLLVAAEGLFDTSGAEPRPVAAAPVGAPFLSPASGVRALVTLDGAQRELVLVASEDAVSVADVTDARANPFAQPATFSRVLVPVPGVDLRSMTLVPAAEGVSGFLTTSTQNLRFSSTDLVRWSLTPVPTPVMDGGALPLAVWAEADAGRTGFSDGRVWSLPVMVPLTEPLVSSTGGALAASSFGRRCGALFAATREGVFRVGPPATDGGLPRWAPVPAVNGALDELRDARLYETRDVQQRLFVGTRSGQVLELTGSQCN